MSENNLFIYLFKNFEVHIIQNYTPYYFSSDCGIGVYLTGHCDGRGWGIRTPGIHGQPSYNAIPDYLLILVFDCSTF